MSFIPDDELKGRISLNLAPMIDFLFLLLMFFATLAVTRITTKDTEIKLVEIKPETASLATKGDADLKVVHITINAEGKYKWVTEVKDYPMNSSDEIKKELISGAGDGSGARWGLAIRLQPEGRGPGWRRCRRSSAPEAGDGGEGHLGDVSHSSRNAFSSADNSALRTEKRFRLSPKAC